TIEIIWVDRQGAVQNRFLVFETAQMTITEGELLQFVAVPRVEINGALQAAHCLFLFPLTTLDKTLQLENPSVIGQGFGGDFQFGHSAIIIKESTIKMSGAREVRFACIWMEAKCRRDCRFS